MRSVARVTSVFLHTGCAQNVQGMAKIFIAIFVLIEQGEAALDLISSIPMIPRVQHKYNLYIDRD